MGKPLILLGATGDIGTQALDILRFQDEYDLVGVAFHSRFERLEPYLFWFDKLTDIVMEEEAAKAFLLHHPFWKGKVHYGEGAIEKLLLRHPDATVINAISGNAGILPTLSALKNNQDLLLANKESYVVGSSLMKRRLASYTGHLYPIDSEHVGLFKCLAACRKDETPVSLMITASGGALRDKRLEDLSKVKPEEVLAHPTWKMSPKITVDCATLVNKGYEVIEASEMFSYPMEQIEAKICRSSLIHAGVTARNENGELSTYYEYSPCSMKNAIAFALSKGKRTIHHCNEEEEEKLKKEVSGLTPINPDHYPLFALTKECYRKYGNTGMFYYNALDSKVIEAFLNGEVSYDEIACALFYLFHHMPERKALTEENLNEFIKKSEIFASQLLDKKPWRSQ